MAGTIDPGELTALPVAPEGVFRFLTLRSLLISFSNYPLTVPNAVPKLIPMPLDPLLDLLPIKSKVSPDLVRGDTIQAALPCVLVNKGLGEPQDLRYVINR